MTVERFPDTDTLHTARRPSADAGEAAPDVVLDDDESGHVIGMTDGRARCERADLGSFSVTAIPALAA